MATKQHFYEIDVVKGIAILFVLWHHSFILYPINMLDIPWCQYAMAIHGTFYLNVFFLISGYLYANSTQRSFLDNFKKKASRLLIPYFSYAVINLIVKIAFPSLVNRKVEGIDEYILKFFFYGGELWFVYVLFLIFLIWPPILQRMDKKNNLGVILLLIILIGIVPSDLMNGIFMFHKLLCFSIFFVTGYLLRNINREILINKRNFYISLFLFSVFCVALVQTIHISYIWGYVLAFIGCWFVWSLSFQLQKIQSINNVFSFCGKNSLAFYWLNGFALVPARILVIKVLHVESTPLIALGIFLLCVLFETLIILSLKKVSLAKMLIGIN